MPYFTQDVADEGRWTEIMAAVEAVSPSGRPVNNAGVAPIVDIETTSTATWR